MFINICGDYLRNQFLLYLTDQLKLCKKLWAWAEHVVVTLLFSENCAFSGFSTQSLQDHYENMPIQIYRKFHLKN